MYTKLFQLKIPSGWAIIHNSFGDEDPVVCDGVIVNDEFYNEDLLSIERIQFNETDWSTDLTGHVFDLGWYPESDPKGSYRLTLLRGDWNNVVVQFESKDRVKIHAIIEKLFDLITQGVDDQEISRLIKSI
ncbi:hypothetical protein [Nostoc sp. DedQUE09]|uniref:hypothetical protein n=1 Tax=Nostoc sp. DedQUE09 TaxID=3075394 RepID=UPI002AD21144|nr:hypothetical protein [Nostoc sp. DedQUE09]MDZ7951658.1 hypothetical protein [Nostoc sp. DedQUE09]